MRRAQWAEIDALACQPIVVAAAASSYGSTGVRPHDVEEPTKRIGDTDEWRPTNELEEMESVPARSPVATWLPRVAVLAVLIAAGWAGMTFWHSSSEPTVDAGARVDTSSEPQSEPLKTSVLPPIALPPSAGSTASPETAEPVSGWVAVSAPFDISVTNANQPVALDDRGRGMLPPGKYRLRFQNAEVGYDETRPVEVRPSGTTTIDLVPQTTISVTANEPAEVLIDGKPVGQTPYDGQLSFGPHAVTVRTAGGEREIKLSATMKPVQIEVDFTQPQP
jgi:hypothetical protein